MELTNRSERVDLSKISRTASYTPLLLIARVTRRKLLSVWLVHREIERALQER